MTGSETLLQVTGTPDPSFPGITMSLGPTHPSSAGLLTATITACEGVVHRIEVQPGALHRGAEMIFPARDYRQALSLANRHDWQAPFFGEWALALLVEHALGVEVPARAAWVRAVLAEHTRVASHLAQLTFVGHRLQDPALATAGVREDLRERTAELTGNRVHPMAVRLGGIACEPDRAWASAERATLARATALARRIRDALVASGLGRGIAVVTDAHLRGFGLAGPVARASGMTTDLRRGAPGPWAAVPDLLVVNAPTTGDAHARLVRLAAEVEASAAMVDRFLDQMPAGPLLAHLPKVVKLPEGDWDARVEAPLGRAAVVVTSRGDRTPWRLRLRTASFANVSAWSAVFPGTPTADLAVAMASLPWVAGDLDK